MAPATTTWLSVGVLLVIVYLGLVPAQEAPTTPAPSTPVPSTRPCIDAEFFCGYYTDAGSQKAECIPLTWSCDKDQDCKKSSPPGRDEDPKLCDCKEDEFSCDDVCHPGVFKCDKWKDCTAGEDERDCVYDACPENHLDCAQDCKAVNGTCGSHCVPPEGICNGVWDCFNGMDESVRTCNIGPEKCPRGQFRCNNTKCIASTIICNGEDDCGDNSDEALCSVNECQDPKSNDCSHICTNYNIGYKCSCPPGYKLLKNNTCTEINECQEKPLKCSQLCTNTVGSFTCACVPGYRLDTNNSRSCQPTDNIAPWLLIGNRYQVRKMSLDGKKFERTNKENEYVHVLDFDYESKRIYFADVMKTEIKSMDFNGTDERKLIWHDLPLVEGIAFDWINKKIYWTDSGMPGVFVAEVNGTHVKELHSKRTRRPRAIVVHPRRGLLFWTDWSLGAFIGKIGMDGSNMSKLIENRLFWPNALTIDYTLERFWWADAHLDMIETADLNGQGRFVVARSLPHIYAITVFGDFMYWTDWNIKTIEMANRFDGSNRSVIKNTTSQPYDIHIVHPLRQPDIDIPNPCANNNGGCSHLCLLAPGKTPGAPSYSCQCPRYFVLNADQKTCRANCTEAQFQCGRSDHRCIPLRWKCDNETDCKGGEDEIGCDPRRCPSRKFECVTGTSIRDCVEPTEVCDGKKDCGDGSDEAENLCQNRKCLPREFKCTKGKCIPSLWACDGDDDCGDRSDEGPECKKPKNCTEDEFSCDNGKCIHQFWFCDFDDDCGDKSDEPRDQCNVEPCREGWRRCQTNYRCIPTLLFCDGNDDCRDGSDEDRLACPTCSQGEFQCDNKKCIPKRWHCDFEDDCGDNSDEEIDKCKDVYRSCEEGEFLCDNFKCIRSRMRCDQKNDCGDDSDEKDCGAHSCPPEGSFQCKTGHCILSSFKCDGDRDCDDVSDEEGCPSRYPGGRYCRTDEFTCKNTVCLRSEWVCDGDNDCGDSSDEELSMCSKRDCPAPERFRCDNGYCIPSRKLCDGVNNCHDGSDENNFTLCEVRAKCGPSEFQCINRKCVPQKAVCNELDECGDNSDEHGCHVLEPGSCSESNGGCQYNCTQVDNRYYCSCPDGLRIDPNRKKTCKDINECSGWGNHCPHMCVDTKGSYVCPCAEDFVSETQGNVHVCRANRGTAETLLIAVENNIRRYVMGKQEYTDAIFTNGRVRAIDVDSKSNIVYWTDTTNKNIYRAKVPLSNREKSFPVSLKIPGLVSPEGVAVDWINGNIYFTDSRDGRIMVAKSDGRYPKVLIGKSARRPTAIAVSPQNGLIFWVDPANKKIESAWMDGTHVRQVAGANLADPTGISVDHYQNGSQGRLYWVDHKRNVIESASLTGANRVIVAHKNLSSPFAIDVFESSMYWVSKVNGTLQRMNKFGLGVNVTLVTGLVFPQDVKMLHALKQPQGRTICAIRRCTHVCVPIPNGSKCLCPENTGFRQGSTTECDAEVVAALGPPEVCKCKNGGTCIHSGDLETPCSCLPDYTGRHCETKVKQVTPKPNTGPPSIPDSVTTTTTTEAPVPKAKGGSQLIGVIIPIVVIIIIAIIVIIIAVVLFRRGCFGNKKSGHGVFRAGAPGEAPSTDHTYDTVVHYDANGENAQFSNPIYDQVNSPGTEAMSAQEYAGTLPVKHDLSQI